MGYLFDFERLKLQNCMYVRVRVCIKKQNVYVYMKRNKMNTPSSVKNKIRTHVGLLKEHHSILVLQFRTVFFSKDLLTFLKMSMNSHVIC